MFRVWLLLLPITIMAQDFEALNHTCYEDAKLLICSKFYSDFFTACEENTDISHLSYHRPTNSICVKKHTELCISGDFCNQANIETAELNLSERNQKLHKNPELEQESYDRPDLKHLQDDPHIEFKIPSDQVSSREVNELAY